MDNPKMIIELREELSKEDSGLVERFIFNMTIKKREITWNF